MKLAIGKPYHLNEKAIKKVEESHNAKYLGCWAVKTRSGNWSDEPVEVFYQANPDTAKGHTHYFGLYYQPYDQLMICNAESAFSEPITGIVDMDEVYVSRYRHDFVETPSGYIIDGGRDYFKGTIGEQFVSVSIKDGEFNFTR